MWTASAEQTIQAVSTRREAQKRQARSTMLCLDWPHACRGAIWRPITCASQPSLQPSIWGNNEQQGISCGGVIR